MGLANLLLPESWSDYHQELEKVCLGLAAGRQWKKRMATKQKERQRDEAIRPLQAYRDDELQHMRATFFNPHSEFHQARRDFVYKMPFTATPLRLAPHRLDSTAKARQSSAA
jgi:putative two-component system hydrogenase maturation factor HypX/HoxX